MSAVPQPYFDANIDTPVEVEGSPQITTDDVTGSQLIKRSFAVRKVNYLPLAYASPDPAIVNAYLGNEANGSIKGPVLFFDRNYIQVPKSRVEAREVAFTLPGSAATQNSLVTGQPIGWNQYGRSAPKTVYRTARVEYSYAAQKYLGQDPATLFTIPAVTQLTYGLAVVDFTGFVYVSVGNVSIPQPDPKPPIVEPRWNPAGIVSGFSSGSDWIISALLTRWKGPVWQMEVVKLVNLILP